MDIHPACYDDLPRRYARRQGKRGRRQQFADEPEPMATGTGELVSLMSAAIIVRELSWTLSAVLEPA